jgi:hypothetical protein
MRYSTILSKQEQEVCILTTKLHLLETAMQHGDHSCIEEAVQTHVP